MTYADFVKTTDLSNHSPIFYIFGILEETGEIAGICKRAMRGDYGELVKNDAEHGNWNLVFQNKDIRTDLFKEKGDEHWYGTRLLQELGVTWKDIEEANFEKLKKRVNTNTLMGKGDEREDEMS